MEKKKILSIVPAPLLPAVSGGQKATYGPLDALGKIANVVSITDTDSSTRGHTFKVKPLIKHNFYKYFSPKNYKIISQQISFENPNVVLLEQPFMGPIVYLACKIKKVPYFVHEHNVEFMRFKSLGKFWWPILYLIERFTIKKATGVFFITEFDKQLALKSFKIPNKICEVAPYGVPFDAPIFINSDKRREVRARHAITEDEKVFMFFGVLKYLPNIEALEFILQEINPLLKEKYPGKYKILICGGGLSESYNKLEDFKKDHVIYAGFVEDIDEYTQSADVILNPVLSGGGIKTKIVEALGFNKNVVSTKTGAIGVDPKYCGSKLRIVQNNDWEAFVQQAIKASNDNSNIPASFFEVFSWKSIAKTMHDMF